MATGEITESGYRGNAGDPGAIAGTITTLPDDDIANGRAQCGQLVLATSGYSSR